MNKVFTLLYAILLVLSSGWTAEAQIKTVAAEMKKAELDYNSFRYVSAISRLTKVLAADSGHIGAQEMLAYSYAQIRDYDKAVTAYAKVCSHPNPKPESALHFAELLAIKQQYEKSEQWYRKYLRLAPQDKRAQAFGRANLSELSKQNGTWQIHFCNINTSASEYSPTFFKHGLLFCSNRMGRGFTWSVFPWDNTPYTKFFFVDNILNIREDIQSKKTQDSQKINRYYVFNDDNTEETSNDSKILGCTDESFVKSFQTDSKERFSIARRLRGNINSGYHAGPLSVFPDGSVIFTRNNFYRGRAGRSKDGINKLKLYTATGNKLSSVKTFLYNSDEYSTGHPAVSKDGSILVFASDMPGGYGGTDLYYCVRSGRGEWTRPVNLGKTVNTEGNEQFPFLSGDNTLYFASNGHVGFGGLDLFFVKLKEMKPVEPPKNMGSPVNSSFDDFGLALGDTGNEGYFSSNRCGDDNIYHLERASNQVVLTGTIRDRHTKLSLQGSRLILKTLDGADTLRSNAKGEFTKILDPQTDYSLVAQKLGYLSRTSFISTAGVEKDTVIKSDILLNKTEGQQDIIFNKCDSLKKVFRVQNIYYDLDRFEIRPDARPALDELVKLMTQHPEISVITSSHCDSRASDQYNRILSMRRGEAARSYLISHGVDGSRVRVEYYGKSRLVNRCRDGLDCPESAQQINRRTEFDVILNDVNITQLDCGNDL